MAKCDKCGLTLKNMGELKIHLDEHQRGNLISGKKRYRKIVTNLGKKKKSTRTQIISKTNRKKRALNKKRKVR